jgi:formate-dependent phosphoribosylglycinamide formyltransferase (GAR transformylase)
MSSSGGGANLVQAVKELSTHWQLAKVHWRDVKAQEFERKYIDVLPDHIARTMQAVQEIEALLKKVRKDCE